MTADASGTAGAESAGLTAPFWAAVERHELVRPYCPGCDRSFFTPQLVCPGCRRAGWEWRLSSGQGSIYSFTTVHRAPVPGLEVPYVLAVVDLEEGWSMLSTIVDVPPDRVTIGQPVAARWVSSRGRTLPAFAPVQV